MRFIDCIHMPVIPIIRRLAHGANQWASEDHAKQNERPMLGEAAMRGSNPAAKGPHGREPCNGFDQLKHGFGLRVGRGV